MQYMYLHAHLIVGCADNCAACDTGDDDMCTRCEPGYLLTGGSPGTCSGKEQQQMTTQSCHHKNNSTIRNNNT